MQTESAALTTPFKLFDKSRKIFAQSQEVIKKSRISFMLIFPEIAPVD